ncbi:MAG: AraC family transcriptional regulator [Novosphingobium sp.]
MAMEPASILEGVKALADATHSRPMALIKCADTDICTWSIEAKAYNHVEVPDMLIGVLTSGDVRWATQGRSRTGCFRRGRIAIIPAATALNMEPVSPLLATTVHISPERTNRVFHIDYGATLLERANLKLGLNNQLIASSLVALDREVRKPSQKGSVFVDSVIAMLLHQALFSNAQAGFSHAPSGLSPAMLRRVREYVEAEISGPIRLEDLASLAGLSQFYFCKAFKAETGVTPHQYVINTRVSRAKELLANTENRITDIALAVGFSSHAHFSSTFSRIVGTSPALYRREFA